jgi:hypothetical protein
MMATGNAAQLVDLQDLIGSLAPTHAADLVVIRDTGKAHNKDAYWSLTHAAPQDVELVMIGSEAVYGDPEMMRQFSAAPLETLRICGIEKAISFASEKQPSGSFAGTESKIEDAMRELGGKLAPLSECVN